MNAPVIAMEAPWQDFLSRIDDNSIDLCLTDLPYPTTERYRRVGTTTRTKKSKSSSNDWYPTLSINELASFFEALYPKMKKDTYVFAYVDRDTELLLQHELGVIDRLRELTDRMTSDPDARGNSAAIKDRIGFGWRNSTDWFMPGYDPSNTQWAKHEPFLAWLLETEYARPAPGKGRRKSGVEPNVSDGLLLYLWEAWQAGQQALSAPGGPDPDEVVRWLKTTLEGESLRPGTGYHGVRCSEQIVCLTKGKPKPRERWNNALFAPRPALRDAEGRLIKGGSPKPVSIARKLIRVATSPGDVVCDPFVGCGTHALAASEEGRSAIVGDISLSAFLFFASQRVPNLTVFGSEDRCTEES